MAAVGAAAAEVVLVLDGGGCERESEPTSAAPAVSLLSIIARRFWPKGRSDMFVGWECGARFRKLMTFRLVWCCYRGGGVTWCNEFACGFSSLNDYPRILAMPLAFV